MFKQILVPLDGSPFAESAIPYACELARQFESEMTLVNVIRPIQLDLTGDAYDASLIEEIRRAAAFQATEYLDGKAGELQAQGYQVKKRAFDAYDVASTLLNVANGGEVDVVVMSTHGRSGLQRIFFGSIAERVVRHAEVPVLLVRPEER